MTFEAMAGITVITYLVGYFLYVVYYAFGLYHINPLIRLKALSPQEKDFLGDYFPIYHELPQNLKEKCERRIVWFRSKKKFVFYGEVENKDELILLLSGSAVFMMLGLKDYRMMRSVIRIIVYPTKYYSRINKKHHLGEYNPRFKSVIFSADTIREGFKIPNDNINLAMHEFAHALSFEMVKKSSWEARKFRLGLKQINQLFDNEYFIVNLAASQYFRDYGMTNIQEFFSVAVENFVETPKIFLNDFPELYTILQRMLNFDFLQSPIITSPKR